MNSPAAAAIKSAQVAAALKAARAPMPSLSLPAAAQATSPSSKKSDAGIAYGARFADFNRWCRQLEYILSSAHMCMHVLEGVACHARITLVSPRPSPWGEALCRLHVRLVAASVLFLLLTHLLDAIYGEHMPYCWVPKFSPYCSVFVHALKGPAYHACPFCAR